MLLGLFSIAWYSALDGQCVSDRDCRYVVRYNLLSEETVEWPRGNDVVGNCQAGVTVLFHYLQVSDAHSYRQCITKEALKTQE